MSSFESLGNLALKASSGKPLSKGEAESVETAFSLGEISQSQRDAFLGYSKLHKYYQRLVELTDPGIDLLGIDKQSKWLTDGDFSEGTIRKRAKGLLTGKQTEHLVDLSKYSEIGLALSELSDAWEHENHSNREEKPDLSRIRKFASEGKIPQDQLQAIEEFDWARGNRSDRIYRQVAFSILDTCALGATGHPFDHPDYIETQNSELGENIGVPGYPTREQVDLGKRAFYGADLLRALFKVRVNAILKKEEFTQMEIDVVGNKLYENSERMRSYLETLSALRFLSEIPSGSCKGMEKTAIALVEKYLERGLVTSGQAEYANGFLSA